MTYQTALHNFLENSQKYREQEFLHQPISGVWHTFSFTEVEQQARKIASGLINQGFEQGDRIGILSKNCAEWFIVDLAIMMAGMISVPIYSTAGAKTIRYVIEHSAMKAMFIGKLDSFEATQAGVSDDLLTISFPYPTLSCKESWLNWLNTYSPLENIHMSALDDCMSIVYTSGTTGDPKGVMISYLNLASAARSTCESIEVTRNDRFVSYLPLAHITERSVVECAAFDSAMQVYFVEGLDTFIDDLQHASPTCFLSVPRLWAKFQAQIFVKMPAKKLKLLLSLPIIGKQVAKKIRKKLGLSATRVFACGSAPIAISLLDWYQKLGINISEGWGMTETSGLSCGNFPFKVSMLGTIGVPVECVEMKLSEQQEILIRGDAVFKQYYLNPEATAQEFTDDWFHTGDKGEISNDGAFKIVGRIKEQFKTSKGKYVVPVPIEGMLCRNSSIEQVCVMGLGLKQPIALVVLGEGIDRHDKIIQQGLLATIKEVNNELESHQRLDFIYVCGDAWDIENELLTPTLKLKRASIEQFYSAKLPQNDKNKVVVEP
ncbi:AMP-binding protein [Thalassotalea fonticola]|uniref:AMP-binding protein n=1 Tax=Thalassotalea fonticola TaxID=3065649 RepID=A0ABZ0GR34_9GAMM|nr:AMP-binding protein [Colwelliaceae bacterium S1-1]